MTLCRNDNNMCYCTTIYSYCEYVRLFEVPSDFLCRQEKHLHRTWKYARLFDERVFAELQTKNSAFLVTVLAYLNRILGTSGAENVLRIKQIEHIVQNDRWGSRYEAIAKRIFNWVAMRKETPECRTDEWKSIEINVENYVKKRRENRAPNKQLEA